MEIIDDGQEGKGSDSSRSLSGDRPSKGEAASTAEAGNAAKSEVGVIW